MNESKPLTHTAHALKREGRATFRWLEIGTARITNDPQSHHEIFVDRLPIGGFNGRIYLSPIGTKPPDPKHEPQRPSQAAEALDADEDI
jgi:hypothetical protein